jgi:hypothetical protein
MKTKKVTFGKSLENLTKYQFEFLQNIKGGDVPIVVHIPTRANPACAEGFVWNDRLNRCIRIGEIVVLEEIRTR